VLILLTRHAGIIGAAAGWALRMLLDAGLLYWMSARVAHVGSRAIRDTVTLALGAVALLCALLFVPALAVRIGLAAVELGMFGWVFWRAVMNDDDRLAVIRIVRRLRSALT
jgi:hypothetical protein